MSDKSHRLAVLPATALLVAVLSAVGATQSTGTEFRWTGNVATGRAIEVRGVNGDVTATPATGGQVEVVARKRARRSDPESVRIEVVEHQDGVTICAVYPSDREPNECLPGGGGRNNVRNNDVTVDFTVHVPAGVELVARTVNGDVSAQELGADVTAATVNGSVSLSTAGAAEANTVNGSITARLGRADWNGSRDFRTVNGGITLDLPSDLSATLRAETLNGGIESDFPITVDAAGGRVSMRRIRGAIGAGLPSSRELSLSTVNGTIRLRRR